jgi:AmmeMemoRadiSam system protein B
LFGEQLRIVPCLVPSVSDAVRWGEALGNLLRDRATPVGVIVSSDLTHYGPRFHFTPHGTGDAGFRWAHEVNDHALLEHVEHLAADEILPHTTEHRSACGGGAITVTLAACRALGATRARVLMQTSSRAILRAMGHDDDNSVGYAGAVFG